MAFSIGMLLLCVMPATAQPALATEYYPLAVGSKWTYLMVDLRATSSKADPKRHVYVEVERTEPYLDKKTDKEKVVEKMYTGFLLKSTSGDKVTRDHVVVMPDGVYRVHAAETPISPPLPFFKLVLEPGKNSWLADSTSGNTTIKGTFTISSVGVTVPLDNFKKAILVSYRSQKAGDDRIEIDYWFVKDVGMVQQRIRTKSHEVMLKLEKFDMGK
jgi:hypothetical protein